MLSELSQYAAIIGVISGILYSLTRRRRVLWLSLLLLALGFGTIAIRDTWSDLLDSLRAVASHRHDIALALGASLTIALVASKRARAWLCRALTAGGTPLPSDIQERLEEQDQRLSRSTADMADRVVAVESRLADLSRLRVLVYTTAHDIGSALTHWLRSRGPGLSIDLASARHVLAQPGLYDALVLVNADLRDTELDLRLQNAIESYVHCGGGLVAIHDTVCAYPRSWGPDADNEIHNKRIVELCGVEGIYQTAATDGVVKINPEGRWDIQFDTDHFIADGASSFTVEEELLLARCAAGVTELAFTIPRDNAPSIPAALIGQHLAVAGCREVEAGRTFFWAFGHTDESFDSDPIARLLVRAIQWVARREGLAHNQNEADRL